MTLVDFPLWSQNTKCTTINRNILSLQISGGFALPSSTVICWGRELVTYLLSGLFDSIWWLCLVLSYTSLLAGSAKRLGSSGRSALPCLLRHSACSRQQAEKLKTSRDKGRSCLFSPKARLFSHSSDPGRKDRGLAPQWEECQGCIAIGSPSQPQKHPQPYAPHQRVMFLLVVSLTYVKTNFEE